ncbi:BMP family lipoprotein [Inquilinus limosus]|uniref:BMP family ABC transporter substrate-binding protein n=1 Tax=Inquilinus limosus TaxID=171674 RepID=A0A211ZLH3_9PROT|nr:BMP family ABC transporter substrate-binding protein [Inquilinus limosus]OWJ66024.1 BMP family ABC transporter substrate-binding protein [Inquilinus limosus]
MNKLLSALALSTALVAGAAFADEVKPAVVFDMGGKFDRSFNEGIYNGSKKWSDETGIKIAEFEVTNESQREQALRRMAENGANVIIAVGFAQAPALEIVADEFPDAKFAIIDAVVDKPNVQSIVFKEQEGSFLVGILAAMASKTHTVGFVGGMDIPLIRAFGCGYVQGAHYADPKITVLQNMTGTTPAAWNDPTKGGELARSQFDRSADVVYAAAGATGLGVLQAAADAKKLSIGVDSNQNMLHPGSVLTSMVKRVDVAAYNVFKSAQAGTFKPGVNVLGLKEDGVGWAADENNAKLITPEMKAKVDAASKGIIDGSIKVVDYRTDNSCPM